MRKSGKRPLNAYSLCLGRGKCPFELFEVSVSVVVNSDSGVLTTRNLCDLFRSQFTKFRCPFRTDLTVRKFWLFFITFSIAAHARPPLKRAFFHGAIYKKWDS